MLYTEKIVKELLEDTLATGHASFTRLQYYGSGYAGEIVDSLTMTYANNTLVVIYEGYTILEATLDNNKWTITDMYSEDNEDDFILATTLDYLELSKLI